MGNRVASHEDGSIFSLGHYSGMMRGWIFYLAMFPVYLFRSGNPQIADYFMIILLAVGYFRGYLKVPAAFHKVNKIFVYFLCYIIVANFAVFIGNIGVPTKGLPWFVISMFYVYNYLAFRLALGLYDRYKLGFIKATLLGSILGIGVTIVAGNILPEANEIRGSLSFQTSNQLGYYSLIVTAIILLLQKVTSISRPSVILFSLACLYLSAVSISNAAIGSILILFTVYFFESGIFNLRNMLMIIGGVGVGLLLLFFTEFGQSTIERYEYRVETSVREQAGVSEWEYRGYDRITNHPHYLILGAGEGAYNRFDTFIEDHEMHSSIGTIIFSYGIPGTILFAMLIFALLKGLKLTVVLYSLPIFAYGIAHMGLRFTIFWVALTLFPILNDYSRRYYSSHRRLSAPSQLSHNSLT